MVRCGRESALTAVLAAVLTAVLASGAVLCGRGGPRQSARRGGNGRGVRQPACGNRRARCECVAAGRGAGGWCAVELAEVWSAAGARLAGGCAVGRQACGRQACGRQAAGWCVAGRRLAGMAGKPPGGASGVGLRPLVLGAKSASPSVLSGSVARSGRAVRSCGSVLRSGRAARSCGQVVRSGPVTRAGLVVRSSRSARPGRTGRATTPSPCSPPRSQGGGGRSAVDFSSTDVRERCFRTSFGEVHSIVRSELPRASSISPVPSPRHPRLPKIITACAPPRRRCSSSPRPTPSTAARPATSRRR